MRLKTWLKLFRLPNLFTVPGDPLAGFFLAAGSTAIPDRFCLLVCGASLFLYMSGLLLNDYADQAIDLKERPNRPLPSGACSPQAVLAAAVVLLAIGVAMAFYVHASSGLLAAAITCMVVAYNFLLKSHKIMGPVAMGACRGMSVTMGAFALQPSGQWLWACMGGLILFLYIASVTIIARDEMSGRPQFAIGWGPFFVLALSMISVFTMKGMKSGLFLPTVEALFFLPVMIVGFHGCWRISSPAVSGGIPRIIGQWIGAVILLQAALIGSMAQENRTALLFAGTGLIFWLANRFTVRWFYSS